MDKENQNVYQYQASMPILYGKKMAVFWDDALCGLVDIDHPDDGGSKHL
jgi:hypothetical protein